MTTKKTRKKRHEINRRMSMIVHTQDLSDKIDLEQKITGKDYTTIINQRLAESYENNPIRVFKKG